MKRNVLKAMSAVVSSMCLISMGCFSASADMAQEPAALEITASTTLEEFMTSVGFTAMQVQRIQSEELPGDHYIAYYNLTDNTSYLDDFIWHMGFVTAVASWASTMNYDGYVLNDDLVRCF